MAKGGWIIGIPAWCFGDHLFSTPSTRRFLGDAVMAGHSGLGARHPFWSYNPCRTGSGGVGREQPPFVAPLAHQSAALDQAAANIVNRRAARTVGIANGGIMIGVALR
jgi:hypothetical protein